MKINRQLHSIKIIKGEKELEVECHNSPCMSAAINGAADDI